MTDLPKRYDPQAIEARWRHHWKENNFFQANPDANRPSYSIIMPPPNVTGVLHMGHALVTTLQDVMARWKRMSGHEVLWVPGTDHAGISAQTVVERHLIATEGKRRHQYSRDAFLDHMWRWKEEKEERILHQLEMMGTSCDWSRYHFTLDQQSNHAVRTAFKLFYDRGLITRGKYLVNWDTATQTALADDEVETIERESQLVTIRYPLVEGEGALRVATTRPETLFGDVALAVSPNDPRYHAYIGAKVRLPLTDRTIPIIADPLVDPEFGTGVLKITPAHAFEDYEIAQRHRLPMIELLTPDGHLNEHANMCAGCTVDEGRVLALHHLTEKGHIEKIEPHRHRVGLSYRSKAVIEPRLSEQWFFRMESFKEPLRQAVEKGEVALLPESWKATYYHWIDNLRDWCISRQLWWGHQIPIWYNQADPTQMICYAGEGLPPEVAQSPHEWKQDPDALDTWFSSGLWPLSVLGWPDATPELARFYPTSLLVTGHDILFFWVARMILMGEALVEQKPFHSVFLHGLIYGRSYWRNDPKGGIHYVDQEERMGYDRGDPLPKGVHSKWEKLSKSKGNVIDPLEISAEYGTDAMRMALCASGPQNLQIDLDRRRFEEFRNFANKIWNGARFVLMHLEDYRQESLLQGVNPTLFGLEDRYLLASLRSRVAAINEALHHHQFDKAALGAYDFFWKEFCSLYLEASKPTLFGKRGSEEERTLKQSLLLITLTTALRLLHPIAPFITEELFEKLRLLFPSLACPEQESLHPLIQDTLDTLKAPSCALAPFPQEELFPADWANPSALKEFNLIQECVYTIRKIRGEMGIPTGESIDLFVEGDPQEIAWIQREEELIRALVPIQKLHLGELPTQDFGSRSPVSQLILFIPLPTAQRERECKRLEKEELQAQKALVSLQGRLNNPDFLSKAPPHLVEEAKKGLEEQEKHLLSLQQSLGRLRPHLPPKS